MAVLKDNEVFYKVYDKTKALLAEKVLKYSLYRKYGKKLPHKELKQLYLYISYLDSIYNSKYNYFYVQSLTEISNKLNKL